MDNPFLKRRAQTAPTPENPFLKRRQAAQPTETEVLAGEDPLFQDLNRMKQEGEFDRVQSDPPEDDYIFSQDELYSRVRENPRYKALNDFEAENMIDYESIYMPEELKTLRKERDAELQKIYERTGREKTYTVDDIAEPVIGTEIPIIGDLPLKTERIQQKLIDNPDFDPNAEEGTPEAKSDIAKDYLVDPPDRNPILRAGYQVLENIIGGTADTLKEAKFSEEGVAGRALPDTVPSGGGEALVTEMTTFVLGPIALAKGAKGVAKATGKAMSLGGSLASKVSPEAVQITRRIYQDTLRATGSAVKATGAAQNYMKRVLVGTALGVSEAAVAPDNSEGMVAQWTGIDDVLIKQGVSPERVKDFSLMLDAPVIGSLLNTLGKTYQAVHQGVVNPALGGIRNVSIFQGKPGKLVRMGEKTAGLKVVTWLDPNLVGLAPEDAVFKMKILSDSLERNATRQLKLGEVGKEVTMDTPTAFTETVRDYYRIAYAERAEAMGQKEFNDWVGQQATETANRLFELRTAMSGDPQVASKIAQTSTELRELFEEGAETQAGGSLNQALDETGQLLASERNAQLQNNDLLLENADVKAQTSKEAFETSLESDPELGELLRESIENNPLGSERAMDESLRTNVADPLYASYRKLKADTDEVYQALAKTGAQGDANSLLQIIREGPGTEIVEKGAKGEEVVKFNIESPTLKKIANKIERDDSFGNIYNDVRKDVSDYLRRVTETGKDPEGIKDTLIALSKNIREDQIEFMKANGDEYTAGLVDAAKEQYQKLNRAWYDNPQLEQLARGSGKSRLAKENFPEVAPGVKQGQRAWDINAIRTVQQNLEGSTGDIFRESLEQAAREGNESVAQGLSDYYTAKAVNNLADRLRSGDTQGPRALHRSISGLVENLERFNSPLVPKLKAMQTRIEVLQNAAKVDEKALEQVKEQARELTKEANASVLKKFVVNGESLGPGNTGRTIEGIFKDKKSVPQLKELIKRAEGMGDRGTPILEALRGQYIEHIKNQIYSKRDLGIGDVVDGKPKSAFKANAGKIDSIFGKNSHELDNIALIFKDQPEVVDQIRHLADTLDVSTKTTPRAREDVLGQVAPQDDPSRAIQNLIVMSVGVLNPTATMARRLTTPSSARSLQQVQDAQKAVLVGFLTDAKYAAEIVKKVERGVDESIIREDLSSLFSRAGIRTLMTTQDEMPDEVRQTR